MILRYLRISLYGARRRFKKIAVIAEVSAIREMNI
jgi:hypothetical protein